MRQNRCMCFVFLFISFVLFQGNIVYGQFKVNGDTTKHEKVGKVIYNRQFLKYFAILMQDTSLIPNRFTTEYEAYRLNPRQVIGDIEYYYFPAFIVDSTLFIKCEKMLLNKESNVSCSSSYLFEKISEKKYKKILKHSIRLYTGYQNGYNEVIIVVVVVSVKMYKRYKNLYQNSAFSEPPAIIFHIVFRKGEY